ncbi:hypothetical protein L1281_002058 [Neisseria sp. HSC-16F19]|nr:hypothetical protein [Neisseria sp. HSC-16F19]MCP2041458.1 hypothetical protein [Neisseria sp. HSC-16F19]
MSSLCYRELVQRRLAVWQTGVELKLARAREQEGLVLAVARCLSATAWPYRLVLDEDMGAVFVVASGKEARTQQCAALRQALAARFAVDETGPRWCLRVEGRDGAGRSCRVLLEEDGHGF